MPQFEFARRAVRVLSKKRACSQPLIRAISRAARACPPLRIVPLAHPTPAHHRTACGLTQISFLFQFELLCTSVPTPGEAREKSLVGRSSVLPGAARGSLKTRPEYPCAWARALKLSAAQCEQRAETPASNLRGLSEARPVPYRYSRESPRDSSIPSSARL